MRIRRSHFTISSGLGSICDNTKDKSGILPLQTAAIFDIERSRFFEKPMGSSLELKFLIEADKSMSSWTAGAP